MFGSTTTQGLETAHKGGLDIRVLNPSRGTFHPKLYLARRGPKITAAIGSANLTSGLVANIEAMTLLEGSTERPSFSGSGRSRNGALVDDESNKAATVVCDDGRFGVAFTGLARTGAFGTEDWLVDALTRASADGNHRIGPSLPQLARIATARIAEVARARRLDKTMKRLSVVLLGQHHGESPPRVYCFLVSNYDAFGRRLQAEASDQFTVSYVRETRPPTADSPAVVLALGMEQALTRAQLSGIDGLLKDGAPPVAVRDKCVSVLRAAADAPASRGMLGKQLSSLIVPGDPAESVIAQYHSEAPTPEIYLPNQVISTSSLGLAVKGVALGSRDSEGNPVLSVRRVARNARCPCGSGKKYKHCHGK